MRFDYSQNKLICVILLLSIIANMHRKQSSAIKFSDNAFEIIINKLYNLWTS